MAESILSLALPNSSEEVLDPYCDICIETDKYVPVAGYCPSCIEFYCNMCLHTHCRMSVTRQHAILTGTKMPACQKAKPLRYPKCDKHGVEPKDRYCCDHCILICAICSVKDHKDCEVDVICDAYKKVDLTFEEEAFRGEINGLLDTVQKIEKLVGGEMQKLECKPDTIINEARKFRDTAIEKINKSFEDYEKYVFKCVNEQRPAIAITRDKASDISAKFSISMKHLSRLSKQNGDAKYFLDLQLLMENFHEYEKEVINLQQELFSIEFVNRFNPALRSFVDDHTNFANVEINIIKENVRMSATDTKFTDSKTLASDREEGSIGCGQSKFVKRTEGKTCPKARQLKSLKVKAADDVSQCLIRGMCIVKGYLLLTDEANKKLKLFCFSEYKISSLKLSAQPVDVAEFLNSQAVVSMQNATISIIEVKDKGLLCLNVTISLTSTAVGIASLQDYIFFSSKGSLGTMPFVTMGNCNSSNGLFKRGWTRTTDFAESVNEGKGNQLFESPDSVILNNNLIVSDSLRKTLTSIDICTGRILDSRILRGKPRGLASVGDGTFLVCYQSGEICLWSTEKDALIEKGKLKGLSKFLGAPHAIYYCSIRKELFVCSSYSNDFIRRYRTNL